MMDISLKKEETKVITFRVNCKDCDLIDFLVDRDGESNTRSQFIRQAIAEKIERTVNSKQLNLGVGN